STTGGSSPRWRADGKEVFYVAPGGTLMATAVSVAASTVTIGASERLFSGLMTGGDYRYDVARDGTRIIAAMEQRDQITDSFSLLLNWQRLLDDQVSPH